MVILRLNLKVLNLARIMTSSDYKMFKQNSIKLKSFVCVKLEDWIGWSFSSVNLLFYL